MKDKKTVLTEKFAKSFNSGENKNEAVDRLAADFSEEYPSEIPASEVIEQARKRFLDDELPELLSEIILTVKADCKRDDFHSWNYDHLEFIIELSNQYDFRIPKNLINGLPEQLIHLIEWENVESPPCEDEE